MQRLNTVVERDHLTVPEVKLGRSEGKTGSDGGVQDAEDALGVDGDVAPPGQWQSAGRQCTLSLAHRPCRPHAGRRLGHW